MGGWEGGVQGGGGVEGGWVGGSGGWVRTVRNTGLRLLGM